ncbi:hypothetical protein BK809_0007839 [Diplodia seriata]|uniref:Isoflavone reductase family protein n=1 Tax=Diplodia seriata TaxID=420778 RepID=A0A1S8BJM4_9PEZI|nr:hypothetical protein BK809_0007839 [Diplodia seriata]
MVKIAIAGGTSPTLGHAIVSALLKNHPEHTPIILSSRPPPPASPNPTAHDPSSPTTTTTTTTTNVPTSRSPANGAEIRHIDYASPASLAAALSDIHTVISVLKLSPSSAMRDVQLALLSAAVASPACRRFAPSEWGFGCPGARVDALGAGRDEVWAACVRSGLEVARFRCGGFMNYLALGRGFADEEARERAVAGFDAGEAEPFLWDLGRGVAELPVRADGGWPRVTLTEVDDVGRFVAAACALTEGSWVREMDMVGETVGVGEVVGLVGECLGVGLRVVPVRREEWERRAAEVEGVGRTREEVVRKMHAQFALVILEEREGWGILKPTLNELCVNTKPLSVREYLTNYQ